MKKETYRLGIIGTGRIAHRFVPEARVVEGIEVVAVYNPRLFSAEKFAEEFDIGFFTDELDEFVAQVDAVYIASPHDSHVEYSKKMLDAGKHVLCEKPMSFSVKELMDLKQLSKDKGLILMEAVKTAYCPGFKGILDIIQSRKIGEIVDVEACFTKLVPEGSRELNSETCAGSFFELGSYVLLPILKILGMEQKDIHYWSKRNKNGVDIYTKIYFDYGNAIAIGKVGLGAKSEGELIVTGTKGYIKVPAPWWLTKVVEVHYEDANATERYEFEFEGQGLRYEIQEFVERMRGSEKRRFTIEESVWFAERLEEYFEYRKR